MLKTELVPGQPRIAVDHAGSGPLLLFLHGIGGNRTNWREQVEGFARDYHAAAWDARGYGKSDDYDGPFDFADVSADLVRVLDHFGVRRAHLCGLSMGGRILLDFAVRHPDRIATLILCDTHSGFSASFTPAQREEFVRLRAGPLRAGKEPKDMAPAVAKTLIGPKASPAMFERLVASMAALHKESYIKAIEAAVHYDRVANLPKIAAPTLLVYGADDRLTPPRLGEEIAAKIPGARLEVIPDAGHLVNIEQPAAFNRVVGDFLRLHRDRAAA